MYVGNMGGDFYLNFFLLVVVEFFVYSFVIFLLDRIGRKKFYCLFMVFGGLVCLFIIFFVFFGDKCKFLILLILCN